MPESKPKISVITVVFNGVSSIEETVSNVLDQSYENLEYIVIDGGSNDGTQDLIKKYQDKISLWISEPDRGIYDAMNKGIAKASGEYVIFMNCGDKFYDADTVKSFFIKNTNEDVIYGDTILNTEGNMQFCKAKQIEMIKYGMPFCHQSVFVKLKLMKDRKFSLNYKLASDYDFFLSLYCDNKFTFKKIDNLVSIYDNCGASMSLKTIEEKYIISKFYFSFSKSSAFHYYLLKYYTLTSFLKRKLPKKMVERLVKFKREL